jgi:hypothetical protein
VAYGQLLLLDGVRVSCRGALVQHVDAYAGRASESERAT